jgi:hypothetical protein
MIKIRRKVAVMGKPACVCMYPSMCMFSCSAVIKTFERKAQNGVSVGKQTGKRVEHLENRGARQQVIRRPRISDEDSNSP